MTKVVKIEKNGGPEVLEIKNVDIKDPQPDQVLIEQKAIGLNYIDTYHRAGSYPLPLPTGIGLEAAGVIKKIGSKVKDLSVGDLVAYAGVPLGAYAEKSAMLGQQIADRGRAWRLDHNADFNVWIELKFLLFKVTHGFG